MAHDKNLVHLNQHQHGSIWQNLILASSRDDLARKNENFKQWLDLVRLNSDIKHSGKFLPIQEMATLDTRSFRAG